MTTEPPHPALLIDRRSPAPLYHQIAVTLTDAIRAGRFPCGSVLPTEPTLVRQLRVSRPTVHAAMIALLHAGTVEPVDAGSRGGHGGTRWRVSEGAAPDDLGCRGGLQRHPTATRRS